MVVRFTKIESVKFTESCTCFIVGPVCVKTSCVLNGNGTWGDVRIFILKFKNVNSMECTKWKRIPV